MLAIIVLMLWLMPEAPIPLPVFDGHAPVVVEQQARDLERDLNADRERENLPPLHSDARLRAMALDWALHMANERFFGHFDPEGRGLVAACVPHATNIIMRPRTSRSIAIREAPISVS